MSREDRWDLADALNWVTATVCGVVLGVALDLALMWR